MFGLLTALRGQLLPSGPIDQQRALARDFLVLHGDLRESKTGFPRKVTYESASAKLQVAPLQQRDQLPQRRQRATRVCATRHLLAAILICHPSRYELTPILGLDFELLDSSTAKSADNAKLSPSVEGMKGVIDGHRAQIAGIILGRPKGFPLLNSVTRTSFPLTIYLSCLQLFAVPSSTHIRKVSFTAI